MLYQFPSYQLSDASLATANCYWQKDERHVRRCIQAVWFAQRLAYLSLDGSNGVKSCTFIFESHAKLQFHVNSTLLLSHHTIYKTYSHCIIVYLSLPLGWMAVSILSTLCIRVEKNILNISCWSNPCSRWVGLGISYHLPRLYFSESLFGFIYHFLGRGSRFHATQGQGPPYNSPTLYRAFFPLSRHVLSWISIQFARACLASR